MKATKILAIATILGTSGLGLAQEERPQRGPGQGQRQQMTPEQMEEMRARVESARAALIAKYDEDGTGTLSPEQVAKAREERQAELLKRFDADGDGQLSGAERRTMREALSPEEAAIDRALAMLGGRQGRGQGAGAEGRQGRGQGAGGEGRQGRGQGGEGRQGRQGGQGGQGGAATE